MNKQGPEESEETRRRRLPSVLCGYADAMDRFEHLQLDSDHTDAMRRAADDLERLRNRNQDLEEELDRLDRLEGDMDRLRVAYCAAIQQLQRMGAESVPLYPDPPPDSEPAKCRKCGYGSEEHGMPTHPAYQCVADMKTSSEPAGGENGPLLCPACRENDEVLAVHYTCDGCQKDWSDVPSHWVRDDPMEEDDTAEQQDAMLERREALDALVSVLPEIEFGRETHRKWRDYLRVYHEQIKENPDMGDADFHAQMVETYDARIGAIRKAQRALSRTSDEDTGCVVPEAVRRLPDRMREHAKGLEGTEAYMACRWERHWADELDRAIAEQGVPERMTELNAPYNDLERRVAYSAGWNDCRRKMLAAAPQPDQESSDE